MLVGAVPVGNEGIATTCCLGETRFASGPEATNGTRGRHSRIQAAIKALQLVQAGGSIPLSECRLLVGGCIPPGSKNAALMDMLKSYVTVMDA